MGSPFKVRSGIENLVALKTTGSSFAGYIKDPYTTLKETSDRILATAIQASWKYRDTKLAYGACWRAAREAMLKTFAGRESPSVQQTAYEMGEAVRQEHDQETLGHEGSDLPGQVVASRRDVALQGPASAERIHDSNRPALAGSGRSYRSRCRLIRRLAPIGPGLVARFHSVR